MENKDIFRDRNLKEYHNKSYDYRNNKKTDKNLNFSRKVQKE